MPKRSTSLDILNIVARAKEPINYSEVVETIHMTDEDVSTDCIRTIMTKLRKDGFVSGVKRTCDYCRCNRIFYTITSKGKGLLQ